MDDIQEFYRQEARAVAEHFERLLRQYLNQEGLDHLSSEEATRNEKLMLAMTQWIAKGKPKKEQVLS